MSPSSRTNAILTEFYLRANPKNVEGMARYGIVSTNVIGLSLSFLRATAKSIGKDHALALELWSTTIYEARLLAALIADPKQLTKKTMSSWVKDFDNWAVCDGVCIHLFRKTTFAHELAVRWTTKKSPFVKRAGFVMIATLAVHDKTAPDGMFTKYLRLIARASVDDRNFVRKAVNWALRQIGKRNRALNKAAIKTAEGIQKSGLSSARWIAADALRELKSSAVQNRLKK
jgi:3-methyladenine DNA glycosylase AlkD